MIQPIVEGEGDEDAVPVLLRRFLAESGVFDLQVGRPIRRPRYQLVREGSLSQSVELARRQPGCSSIIIVFDSDDDCPRDLAPRIQAWAVAAAREIPCAVVMANHEFEAWFLAAIESLRGRRRIRVDAASHSDPESLRGAKEALGDLMDREAGYHPTSDQAALTAHFDMAAAYRRSRSFRRMVSAFGSILQAQGKGGAVWPPSEWMASG